MDKYFMAVIVLALALSLDKMQRETSTPIHTQTVTPILLASSYDKGKKLFRANCMVCHGMLGQGASGPANAGSSLELLKAKVLEGKYPPGYKPKRNTRMMPKFPHLKNDIEAIHEYLKDPKP